MQIEKNEKYLLIAIFCISAFFSFYKLGSTLMNVDAQHWFARSQNFVKALKKLNFAKTYQDPKPGVPVMWLSGISLEAFLSMYETKHNFRPLLYTVDTFPLVNFSAIAPLTILQLIFYFLSFLVVARLLDKKVALVYLIFLALHPYYLGNSRFLHVDATMSAFLNLSMLFALYAHKSNKTNALIFLSGVFAGLAMLTKSQSFLIIPFCLGYFLYKKATPKQLFLWSFAGLLAYFIIFPAMWVKPIETLKKVVTEALFVADEGRTSKRPGIYYIKEAPRIFGTIESLLIIFSFSWLYYKKRFLNLDIKAIIVFFLMYLIQMSIVTQKIDRYMVSLFPTYMLIVAYGLTNAVNPKYHLEMVLFLLMALTARLYYFAPYYETFVIKNFKEDIYGSLFDQVGKYINQKTNNKGTLVAVMTKNYSLQPFVNGTVLIYESHLLNKKVPDFVVGNDYWFEYRGKPDYMKYCKLDNIIKFRNKVFWDIYSCEKP